MFESLFSAMRWQDVVDILINSYILFRLLIVLRGTRLFRVLTVVIVFFILQRLSYSIGLIITSWVLQGITALAAIVVIIVFRNEIRTAFQAKNMGDLIWRFPKKSTDTPTDALVSAVFDLARARIGAILVFPGRQDLEGIVYGGVSWQGKLSREMIKSVFWPGNPVHDGAAIVNGDQVAHVGAILPLSSRTDLPSHYGTRHRAALGLAEQTDAVVVVVSEERGDVTVARRDVLTPVRSPESLLALLKTQSGESRRVPTGKREEKFRIAAAAAICLFVVSAIWFSFSVGSGEALATLEVPVEYDKRDPAMEIVQTSASKIRLQLSGPKTLVQAIMPDQVKVRFDLSRATAGVNTLTVGQGNIELPPGISLNNVEPDVIKLEMDEIVRKVLPIQVDWTGPMPKGRRIAETRVIPPTIEVSGTKQVLNPIETLYTLKIPVDSLSQEGDIVTELAIKPGAVRIVSPASSRVRVHYRTAARELVQETP
ncbi:MAG: diadenylate cyclase [Desulfobacterales bacterium]